MLRNNWGGGVMLPFLQLAHMVDVTQQLGWNTVAREQRKKNLVVKSVVHSKSEWTRKVKVRGKNKVAGTQQIDRCWFHLKKFCPKQMKSRTGPTLNGRFWDRIYQWVFRHNSRK